MGEALYEIDLHIARLLKVAELSRAAAPGCAEALEEFLRRSISQGRAPDGTVWEPRKEDGGKPLVNAAQALAVVPVGSTVFARVKGPEARHHKGIGKGGVTRRILPTGKLPEPVGRAFVEVIKQTFIRITESR